MKENVIVSKWFEWDLVSFGKKNPSIQLCMADQYLDPHRVHYT